MYVCMYICVCEPKLIHFYFVEVNVRNISNEFN